MLRPSTTGSRRRPMHQIGSQISFQAMIKQAALSKARGRPLKRSGDRSTPLPKLSPEVELAQVERQMLAVKGAIKGRKGDLRGLQATVCDLDCDIRAQRETLGHYTVCRHTVFSRSSLFRHFLFYFISKQQ